MIAAALDRAVDSRFANDVREGLSRTQKELPSSYLYDALGSALFDAITFLPEYGLTRADSRLLAAHSNAIVAAIPRPFFVAELGSGSGSKTRWILESAARNGPIAYFPIDISPVALQNCCLVLERIPNVRITELHGEYLDGLAKAVAHRKRGEKLLLLFLGSTIGNFYLDAAANFLAEIRGQLSPGDGLLLGADLVKPVEQMLLAYDDPIGVTGAFNLNVLGRINRELGGDFNLAQFAHEARFNEKASCVEMHLRSKARQSIYIEALNRTFEMNEGETIWTESSQKFRIGEIDALAAKTGFRLHEQWIDSDWAFAESLMIAN